MAVYKSDYIEAGNVSLGGTSLYLLVMTGRIDVGANLAVGDYLQLTPIDGTAKLVRLTVEEDGTTAIAGAFADLVHLDGAGNETSLVTGISEGITPLYEIEVPSDGILALKSTGTTATAPVLKFMVEITHK